MVPPAYPSRPLRKDAARNRERVLTAARTVMAEQGLEAPLEEIARRAGVGVGTLYRRFPRRADLVEAVFLTKAEEYLAAAREGLAAADGWAGFVGYLRRLCALQAADRSLADVLTLSLPDCPLVAGLRAQIAAAQRALVGRAQREGTLRADFAPGDVAVLLFANAGVLRDAPEAWERHLALTLDALRADAAATPLPGPAPAGGIRPRRLASSTRT